MIIPIKCFTCGGVLADKYRYYQEQVRQKKNSAGQPLSKVMYLSKGNMKKTPEAEVLDELQLYNVCCRRHMLTHVDIE